MHTSGDRVSTVTGGVAYSARGEIKLDPSNMTVAAGVNQDGTVYRTVGPKVRTAEISFDRFVDNNGFPMKWDESVLQQVNLGFTFIEQDTGVIDCCPAGSLRAALKKTPPLERSPVWASPPRSMRPSKSWRKRSPSSSASRFGLQRAMSRKSCCGSRATRTT